MNSDNSDNSDNSCVETRSGDESGVVRNGTPQSSTPIACSNGRHAGQRVDTSENVRLRRTVGVRSLEDLFDNDLIAQATCGTSSQDQARIAPNDGDRWLELVLSADPLEAVRDD